MTSTEQQQAIRRMLAEAEASKDPRVKDLALRIVAKRISGEKGGTLSPCSPCQLLGWEGADGAGGRRRPLVRIWKRLLALVA